MGGWPYERYVSKMEKTTPVLTLLLPFPLALRTSIGLVLNTLDESMASYKFPLKIAAKLQGFVDYR